MISDSRFSTVEGRKANADAVDRAVAEWIEKRPLSLVLETFQRLEAPIAPVMDVSQIVEDAHYRARRTIMDLEDVDIGTVTLPNVVPRLSRTPGTVRHLGRTPVGADSEEVLSMLGYSKG